MIITTNVDGILDEKGEVIPEITEKNIKKIHFYGATGTDVTGGMERKANELLELAKETGISSMIINGTVDGRLGDTLWEEEVTGTEIKKSE